MKTRRKLLALVLTFCMALSLVPFGALAEDTRVPANGPPAPVGFYTVKVNYNGHGGDETLTVKNVPIYAESSDSSEQSMNNQNWMLAVYAALLGMGGYDDLEQLMGMVESGGPEILMMSAFSDLDSVWPTESGYQLTGFSPVAKPESKEALSKACKNFAPKKDTEVTVYLLWSEEISEVELDIAAPKCGESVSDNAKNIKVDADTYSIGKDTAKWHTYDDYFNGGERYVGELRMEAAFGYCFADTVSVKTTDPQVRATGFNIFSLEMSLNPMYIIRYFLYGQDGLGSIPLYVTFEATASHDWGEWAEKTAATTEARGEETRSCSGCGEEETRETPKIGEKTYTITVDMGGHGENVIIPDALSGQEVADLVYDVIPARPVAEGYYCDGIAPKPLDQYKDREALKSGYDAYEDLKVTDGDVTVYAIWLEEVTPTLTVTPPQCGDPTKKNDKLVTPDIVAPDDAHYKIAKTEWASSVGSSDQFIGKGVFDLFDGATSTGIYRAFVRVEPDFGYTLTETADVTGATLLPSSFFGGGPTQGTGSYMLYVSVEHRTDETSHIAGTVMMPPTCEEDGVAITGLTCPGCWGGDADQKALDWYASNHAVRFNPDDENMQAYEAALGKLVNPSLQAIPALGHQWSAWELDPEKENMEFRTCKRVIGYIQEFDGPYGNPNIPVICDAREDRTVVQDGYAITVEGEKDGNTVFADYKTAKDATVVTVTVEPNGSSQVKSVTAKTDAGADVTLTEGKDGTYTFTMPAAPVTVTAVFEPKPIEDPKLPADSTFNASKLIRITSNTAWTVVYYTTDGSEPSQTRGTLYSGPFTVTDTTTVKAVAVYKTGDDTSLSNIVSGTYTKAGSETPDNNDDNNDNNNTPGGGGAVTYPVNLPTDTEGGKITAKPTRASEGSTVTLTLTPDEGNKVDKVTVTDKDGNPVEVKDNGDGTYTFKMPKGGATVSATFVKDEGAGEKFVDVPKDAWYHDAVYWAVDKGITQGTDATHFSPDGKCTRGQMVTFLWRYAGEPAYAEGTENPFTDVTESDYYYDAVLWAVEKGITVGTSATTFSPNETVTRGQGMTFLWRYEGEPAPTAAENPFTDVTESDYYYDAVLWAVEKGVTVGTSKTTFSPKSTCLRSQVVTFLYRLDTLV